MTVGGPNPDALDVGGVEDFAENSATKVDVRGTPVAVVRIGDDFYAIGDVCTHANVSLSEGEVWCDEREIECPKHGSAFSLISGQPNSLPATRPALVYRVEVTEGRVFVAPPGLADATS